MSGALNTLIISDLHLGEDLNPNGASHAGTLDIVERQLIDFLRHYTRMRRDGRPWRLVVNGDMVDFLSVHLLPGDERVEGEGETDFTPQEAIYGLGRRPRVARAKMQAVVERHRDVFRALGRFVRAGNAVDIIAGNHDAELQWPAVQDAFRAGIADASGVSRELVDAAVTFHPWFFYEPGVAWIEHGHNYDENCSFDFSLAPAHPESGEIVPNVDSAAQRCIINRIPGADHGQEEWSMVGYLRWAAGQGIGGGLRLARAYYAFAASLLGVWRGRSKAPDTLVARKERHLERLRALCERWRVSEETLSAVDELRKRPVASNLWRLLGVLMIDKLVIFAVTLLVTLVLVASLPWGYATLAAAGVVGSAWVAARWVSRGRIVDPSVPLGLIPERILRHVDARYVVFGHAHQPARTPLENGGIYFNTGTWYPSERPGLLRSFTHVVIHHAESGPRAELCQWRDGASREFTPESAVSLSLGRRAVTATDAAPASAEAEAA